MGRLWGLLTSVKFYDVLLRQNGPQRNSIFKGNDSRQLPKTSARTHQWHDRRAKIAAV
jgi:hypothetical protein